MSDDIQARHDRRVADIMLAEEGWIRRAVTLLRTIEWEGGTVNPFNNGWCPCCLAPSEFKMELSRHEGDCELAALLKECEAS